MATDGAVNSAGDSGDDTWRMYADGLAVGTYLRHVSSPGFSWRQGYAYDKAVGIDENLCRRHGRRHRSATWQALVTPKLIYADGFAVCIIFFYFPCFLFSNSFDSISKQNNMKLCRNMTIHHVNILKFI